MSNVKAIIKLATGNVGFYDNLTKIHLTIASPIAKVFEGMNTTNLKNGVRCKTIEVLEGSLYDVIIDEPKEEEEEIPAIKVEELPKLEEVEEEKKEPVVEEETREDVPTTLEEPIVEEQVEPKKSSRKRSSKKATKEEQSSTEESK